MYPPLGLRELVVEKSRGVVGCDSLLFEQRTPAISILKA
jgi:hypothetical protein